MASSSIESLPNEILVQIFSHLDGPPPSASRLHEQPAFDMLASDATPLKAVSRVSKLWRTLVLPLLFRNTTWRFNRRHLLEMAELHGAEHMALLAFLRREELTPWVRSLALVVTDGIDGPSLLPGEGLQLEEDEYERAIIFNQEMNWLWRALFQHLAIDRLTLVASPRMLATLLSRMIFLSDAWSFTTGPHILSLSLHGNTEWRLARPPEDLPATPPPPPRSASQRQRAEQAAQAYEAAYGLKRAPCDLFTLRPWRSVLVNEGSSTRVYKTYEFFLKRPPSIVGALLGSEEHPNDEPLLPPTIREFSYVAIFPLSHHFHSLINHLPPLDRLFVQLVPRHDLLSDADELRNVDVGDLWMERNTSYAALMRELFDPASADSRWLRLRVFESGDAADRESWRMAVNHLEYTGATAWRVEREGVIVRCGNEGEPFVIFGNK